MYLSQSRAIFTAMTRLSLPQLRGSPALEHVQQARQTPGEDYGDSAGISFGTIILQS